MCAFGGVGFCWGGGSGRQIVLLSSGLFFFFFKFWLGVGRTGLSGLSASPLVLRSWGGERGSGGGFASPLKASAVHSPGSS